MANTIDILKGLPPNPEKATLEGRNKFLGLWFFLGGETILFGTFFGTYLGMRNGIVNGLASQEVFQLPLVFIMTMLLLTSSLTSVLAIFFMKKNNFKKFKLYMWFTVLLGIAFVGFEIYEFYHYVFDLNFGFETSAFASSFYTLVGLHGLHVIFGLIWITVLLIRYNNQGITLKNAPKFYLSSLYWHFIDVIWIFIFTVVYLFGVSG